MLRHRVHCQRCLRGGESPGGADCGTGSECQVDLKVCRTGCSGECEQGPLVRLMPRDTMYYKVKPADAPAIIASLEGDR